MRAALYPRVSTVEQEINGYSIGDQIEKMKKYCEVKGWEVYKVYNDAGHSGATLDRPALEEMIADVKRHKFDVVLVYKLDRLSRSQKNTLYLIEDIFLPNGIDFVSITENFDTATPFGRAMLGILAVFAQLERDQIGERTKAGLIARAKAGKWHGSSNSPIGYNFIDDELVVNEYEAMQIRELFNLFNMRLPVARIMAIMNERGYKTRYGHWHRQNLKPMIQNRTYIGEVSYSGVWYEGHHTPIVDLDTFNKAQAVLADKETNNKHASRYKSTIAGLVKCGWCGNNYYIRGVKRDGNDYATLTCAKRSSNNKKWRGLTREERCKNHNWRVNKLESLVHESIMELALHPETFPDPPKGDDHAGERELVSKRIAEIDDGISRLTDLYAVGGIDINVIREKVEKLSEEKGGLQSRMKALQPAEKIDKKDAVEIALSISTAMESGTFEEAKAMVSELIERVVIDGDDVHIYWRFA